MKRLLLLSCLSLPFFTAHSMDRGDAVREFCSYLRELNTNLTESPCASDDNPYLAASPVENDSSLSTLLSRIPTPSIDSVGAYEDHLSTMIAHWFDQTPNGANKIDMKHLWYITKYPNRSLPHSFKLSSFNQK